MSACRAVAFGLAGLLAAGAVAMAGGPLAALDASIDSAPNIGVGGVNLAAPAAERPAVPMAPERRPSAGERVPTGNPLWAVPLRTLSVTRERPIFSPSRRPPAPPVVAAVAAPPPPPPAVRPAEPDRPLLSLLGTVIGERDGIGVFMEESTRNIVRLHTGEDYSGWVLKTVEGRDARFEKNDRVATLSLPPPDGGQPAGAQPPIPMLPGAAPPLVPPAPQVIPAAAAAEGNTWRDGDGNLIAPPGRRITQQPATPAPAPLVTPPARRTN